MTKTVDVRLLRPERGPLRELLTFNLQRRPERPAVEFPEVKRATGGTFSTGRGVDLAIDFGTSAIAAALVGGHFAVEVLRFGDETTLPAPFGRRRRLDRSRLADNYDLSYAYLGAEASGPRSEQEYYPCLKRRVEWLARCSGDTGWQSEAVLDVAAVCQLALEKARDGRGRPLGERLKEGFQVFVTVPNAFPGTAVDVLRRGVAYGVTAALGGRELPEVHTLLEAEAVAYGTLAGPRLAEQRRRKTLLVLDAGAGTTDASIVRLEDGGIRVLANAGLPVGGMDLDALIASLKGPLDASRPPVELSQWLVTAQQAKQLHLGEDPGGAPKDLEAGFRRLAEELARLAAWPRRSAAGPPVESEIARGYERYMALAVRSLVRALPRDEVARVDEVVLSGRGSLLAGFKDAVRRTVAEHGPTLEPRCASDPTDRKLAVVRGVGAFVASTYGSPLERRPVRASFEILLRHEGGRELTLLPAGHPLVRGWGVAAWHQPVREIGSGSVRPRVEMRLVPHDVLRNLAAEGTFDERDLDDLLRWSILPLIRIDERQPPYSARLAFNFLSLEAQLEVDGQAVTTLDRPESSFGRQHPVHQLDDNWFEHSL